MRLLLLLFLGLPIAQAIDDAVLENLAKKYPQLKQALAKFGVQVTDDDLKNVIGRLLDRVLAKPEAERDQAIQAVFESFKQEGAAGKIVEQFLALLKQGGVETKNADKKGMQAAVEQQISQAGKYQLIVEKFLAIIKGMSPDEMDVEFKKQIEKMKKMKVPQERIDAVTKAYNGFKEKLEASKASADEAAGPVSVDNGYIENKDNNSGIGGKTRVPIYGDMSAAQLFRIFFRRVLIESTA